MLNNTNQKTPRNNDSDQSPKAIQDPWSIPNQVQEQKIIPEALQLGKELYSLISPAGSPGAPSLASHQFTSEEILLEDELKLKSIASNLLKQQLEKALALIYWLKTTKQSNSNWQISSS